MRFKIPGKNGLHVRLFEPVKTQVDGYHLSEIGLEYGDGGVDSLVFGSSPYTLKKWFGAKDDSPTTTIDVDASPA